MLFLLGRLSILFPRALAVLALVLCLVGGAPALAQDAGELRAQGVAAARQGRLEEGRRLLEAALAAAPQDPGILADLVVVLSWAGQDRAALDRFAALGVARAPGYALSAAAVSARRAGQGALAAELYRAALARGQEGVELRLGLALAEADQGRAAAARAALAEAEAAHPGHPRIRAVARDVDALLRPDPRAVVTRLAALAAAEGTDRAVLAARAAARGADAPLAAALSDLLMDLRRPFDALAVLQPSIARDPRDPGLRRREALALGAIGAPELALMRAAAAPGALTPAEERRLRSAANAFLVRWGTQVGTPTPRDPAARYARTDAAIAALDAAIAAWSPLPEAADAVRGARLDRMVALRDRVRMAEVIAEGEALRAGGELPAYAREAYGDALLHQRRPAEAEAEYRAILAEDPGALQTSLALFFALTDQQRWSEAREIAVRLERDVPAYRPVRGQDAPAAEWDRIPAVTAGILWRMWSDDLAGAEAIAAPLAAEAPMNASLRALRAAIWRQRGWSQRALEEYEAALTNAPDSVELRLGRAEALMDRRRWREARAEIEALAREYPENGGVRRTLRRQQLRDRWELEANVRGGLGRDSEKPELDVGVRLYSPPIAEDWRVFSGALLRAGDTRSGPVTTWRALAGVELRVPLAVVTAAATLDMEGVDRGGGFLDVLLRLSDHWVLELGGELGAADTPLVAVREGIHADSARIALTWRHSEQREAVAAARAMEFSDGNTRLIAYARWQERVLNLPDWKLDLQPYVYASSNSSQDVPYFSPERDLEAGATVALTWLAWRRYEQDFRVRLFLTGGGYRQEGFGWSPLFAARWENQHALSDAFAFSYGAGWVRRAYDGTSENAGSVTASLRWRF